MGQTFVEKIFSKRAGRAVVPGTILTVKPDYVLTHDNSAAIYKTFTGMGATKVFDKNQPLIVLDHIVPASSEKAAINHKTVREFVADQQLPHFYDGGRGICHQVVVEEGFARPGSLIVGSDSHTTTYGALGAFSTGIGRSEAAGIWALGEIWLKVPESMKIVLNGIPKKHILSKDVLLHIAGKIKADGALYRSIEFSGSYIENLSFEQRLTLTNMAIELGAKNGYIAPDEKVFSYLEERGVARDAYEALYPDSDAEYAEVVEIDVATIEYEVAAPHTVDNVKNASTLKDISVNQVLIGTCTNGRIEDLRQAAEILADKKVAHGTRLLILPASNEVYLQAMDEGLLKIFIKAGALVLNSGCGPCLGAHQGVMAPGEVTVSTANRNFKGRMGCNTADIYLASPYVAAATAVVGRIATPDDLEG
ncbi:3-isopropylmalate dehydratase large subunit [bacterium]|nr:3-isopropylmalate dehydratase large subunit [bacterium]